jgi:hypothetical protein
MSEKFPAAVPEIRVSNVSRAAVYYEKCLGFRWDWGIEGLGQVSRGDCRLFLTDNAQSQWQSRSRRVARVVEQQWRAHRREAGIEALELARVHGE